MMANTSSAEDGAPEREQPQLLCSAVLPASERPPQADPRSPRSTGTELRDELDASWAARPLALARESGRTALLLNDPGGSELLVRLIDGQMEG